MKFSGFIVGLLSAALLSSVFAADGEKPSARELIQRASEEFFAGKVDQSIKTFEQAIAVEPKAKPHLWQLGIAYYYANRFADGRDLFQLHQTVNSHDVENAVWHFLCVARLDGLEAARKKLIPISGDKRVPMNEIYALFSGSGRKEDVLRAAARVEDDADRRNALCYAHLYLGLYEEARGDAEKSLRHIQRAAGDFAQKHYMGEVARVHAKLRTEKKD